MNGWWSSIVLLLATALVADGRHKTRHREKHHHAQEPHLRVYKGSDVPEDMYPYAVILSMNGLFLPQFNVTEIRTCTGSLIAASWVLSAAHCLVGNIKNESRVYYGNFTNIINSTMYKKGLQAFKYMQDSHTFLILIDIGLLMIEKIDFKSQYGKLSVVDYKSLIGFPVRYIGGGLTAPANAEQKEKKKNQKEVDAKPLQFGEAVVVKCMHSREYRKLTKLLSFKVTSSAYICVSPKCSNNHQGMSYGDSGGPLLFRGKIVGVGCCGSDNYFFFTAVSPFIGWIQNVMATNQAP